MTLHAAAKKAVQCHDARQLGAVVEQLRMLRGYNYEQCFEFVRQATGIDANDFESMMYEADSAE